MISPVIENWTCPETIAALKKYLHMKHFINRLQSFKKATLDDDARREAQSSGFYYVEEKKVVACFSCGLQIPIELVEKNKTKELHVNFSPDCPFICWRDSSLCTAYYYSEACKYYGNPKENLQLDYSAPLTLRSSRIEKHADIYSQEFLESFVINPEKVYQLFQMQINRRYSFKDTLLPERAKNLLVESGFFYTGFQRTIQCAFCRLATDSRRPSSQIKLHHELSPNCPFLNHEKYDIERNFCVVCLVQNAKILYVPCHHLSVCNTCDEKMKSEEQCCPICRMKISNKITCISP
uniref:RING-type domain-containing protein n=1 Tax=Tetranychus urticae TaxID=32264 RepID=A0A158P582_TETUR